MPEGPEVKLYCNDLDDFMTDNMLVDIKIHGGKYSKKEKGIKDLDKLRSVLPLTVKKAKCKGKFIYMILENNWYIWFTLGMAGGLTTKEDEKHNNVEFIREDGKSIFFNDPRNFGNVILCNNPSEMNKKVASLGPSFLDESISYAIFKKIATNPKVKDWPLYRFLVDQKKLSGIGNYLRAEILYTAKLSPFLKMGSLTEAQLKRLYTASKKEIFEAYDRQMKNYKFYNAFKVYKRKEDPKGNPVKSWNDENDRVVWWSPKIQGYPSVPSESKSALVNEVKEVKPPKKSKKETKKIKSGTVNEVPDPVPNSERNKEKK